VNLHDLASTLVPACHQPHAWRQLFQADCLLPNWFGHVGHGSSLTDIGIWPTCIHAKRRFEQRLSGGSGVLGTQEV
jgi:hypothetical protein